MRVREIKAESGAEGRGANAGDEGANTSRDTTETNVGSFGRISGRTRMVKPFFAEQLIFSSKGLHVLSQISNALTNLSDFRLFK